MITKEKIKIFKHYQGKYNDFKELGTASQLNNFHKNEWELLASIYESIVIISKRHAENLFIKDTIKKIKENCDSNSFELLIKKKFFYNDFQKVKEILLQIISKINNNTDTIWAGYDNPDLLLNELKKEIDNIEICDFDTLNDIYINFLPTGSYQELSLSNGWSNEYLKLAERFDIIYDKLTKNH